MEKKQRHYDANIQQAEDDLEFGKRLRGDTGVGLQRFDEVGQQNGPADVQRQNILAVQNHGERRLVVGLMAGHDMDAHHTGAVRVQCDMPHPVQPAAQEHMFRIGQMF